MPRNQGTSRKGKPGKIEKAAGMGRSLLIKNKYKPRSDGKNIYGGSNGMAAIPGMTSIGIVSSTITDTATTTSGGNDSETPQRTLLTSSSTGTHPRSILDMDDLDDFLLQANLAEREFFSERGGGIGNGGNNNHGSRTNEPIQIIDPNRKGIQWADQQQQQQQPSSSSSSSTTTTIMELSVPRRPPWTHDMTREQLELQEKMAFLDWRRKIAQYEAIIASSSMTSSSSSTTTTTTTTPFEKNIHVWKQLWRVIERSNVIIQIIDARNPLFYISYDLYQYVTMELHKPMILLFNKSDYLSQQQRQIWKQYFTTTHPTSTNNDNDKDDPSKPSTTPRHNHHNWTQNCHIVFFSAMREQKKLDHHAAQERKRILQEQLHIESHRVPPTTTHETLIYDGPNKHQKYDHDNNSNHNEEDDEDNNSDDDDNNEENHDGNNNNEETPERDDQDDENISIAEEEDDIDDDDDDDDDVRILTRPELIETMRAFALEHHCQAEERYDYRIQYGMVGFPNVGKSSVINVLSGASKHTHNTVRVAVASQPGKTKHFQTVLLHDQSDIMLCDCPGLVFPSFVSNTADLIAAGVYPIAQMRDHWPVTHLVCQRIPRDILNAHYGIALPVLSHEQLQDRGYDLSRMNNSCNTNDELPPPTAEELLTTYCIARGLLASFSGVPDYQRAARIIIKDYADGKLLYCHPPPNMTSMELKEFYSYTVQTALRNTQRTRERLLKQQQKLQLQQMTVDGTSQTKKKKMDSTKHGAAKKMTALDAFDNDLIQMIAATTMPSSNDEKVNIRTSNRTTTMTDDETKNHNNHKLHYKKSTGAKWGKKDRKNRNKDPYGCHTATPDSTILSMI